MGHEHRKVKQRLKSDLHEEFSHELGLDYKDQGDMTSREAGDITRNLVELGEEMLAKNLSKGVMRDCWETISYDFFI